MCVCICVTTKQTQPSFGRVLINLRFSVSACSDEGNSFMCDFTKCIPKIFVCDGFADCTDSRDEIECLHVTPRTCGDWWAAGFRQSGTYTVCE